MALEIKQLGAGASVGAGTDMYTVPVGKSAIVKNMRFVNTHTTQTALLNVVLRIGASTDYPISPVNVNVAPGAMYIDDSEVTITKLPEKCEVLRGKRFRWKPQMDADEHR